MFVEFICCTNKSENPYKGHYFRSNLLPFKPAELTIVASNSGDTAWPRGTVCLLLTWLFSVDECCCCCCCCCTGVPLFYLRCCCCDVRRLLAPTAPRSLTLVLTFIQLSLSLSPVKSLPFRREGRTLCVCLAIGDLAGDSPVNVYVCKLN